MQTQLKDELKGFISANYLFGDDSRMPADEESLLETGVLDSTGVLELIEFLEEQYGVEVSETETVPENLGSIANLTRFVTAKTAGSSAGAGVSAPAGPVD
jgi:acyl carrier protein